MGGVAWGSTWPHGCEGWSVERRGQHDALWVGVADLPGTHVSPCLNLDQYYWPFTSDHTRTIWIPLQDTRRQMGPLTFAAGSHRRDLGRTLPIGDQSEARIQQELAQHDLQVVDEPFGLGNASFHQGWTFHRAGRTTAITLDGS